MPHFDPEIPNINVQQISNPSKRGITTGRVRRLGTRTYAEIETGTHDRTFIEVDDLELVMAGSDSLGELMKALRFGTHGDLARILTFHKVSSDFSNVFYSMQASRTDFYAHQFKPVYKFIESLNGRILITDEVGLGKTVEAGLIWTEMRARSDAGRLLVICPSMLREKWGKELKDKFNVPAQIYDSQGFIRLIGDFLRERDRFQCAAVCSLQSIRQPALLEALGTLDEQQLRFDLVIVDEAHHLRNSQTKSHQAGRVLSDLTSAMVLLTATPIHLKNEDLFRLLTLLDTDEFNNQYLFELRLSANEPIVKAQNAIRRLPPDIQVAAEQIGFLKRSQWFSNNPLVPLAAEKLQALRPDDPEAVVEAGRLLENLNLFSSVISRTRKREVQEWRVIREPVVYKVSFNEREAEFYSAITEAVRDSISVSYVNQVAAFALMMPQRQMASSIPAMVEHYSGKRCLDEAPDDDLLMELGLPVDNDSDPQGSSLVSEVIRSLVNDWDSKTPDSKYETLARVLKTYSQQEPESKIIVFSYFRKTLIYLQRCLTIEGFRPVVIHGEIPMEERQEILDQFRDDEKINILLSSEVGSEGIDLQFCRVVINYDLPWNPMKVEQRIGRLDRLGQLADKITIINFAVEGTIEQKILDRLYDRIGIFENSIGELEPILGSAVQELTMGLLSHKLTPKQVEQRIEQTQLAIIAKHKQEDDLVEQSAVFFGSSDYILDQISRARKLGRWITPEDIRSFITDFFHTSYPGTNINWDNPEPGLVSINLSNQARNDLALFNRTQSSPLRTELTYTPCRDVVLAYKTEAAQHYVRYEMLSHFHPLIHWITERHKQNKQAFFPTAAVKLQSNLLPSGQYVLAIEFWEFYGLRKEIRLACTVLSVDGGRMPNKISAEEVIQSILREGETWDFADRLIDSAALCAAWERCRDHLFQERENAFLTFQQKTLATTQRRKTHLVAFRDRKAEEWNQRIATMKSKTADAEKMKGKVKGFETALEKHRQSCEQRLEKIERESQTRQEFREIAAVVCQVINKKP